MDLPALKHRSQFNHHFAAKNLNSLAPIQAEKFGAQLQARMHARFPQHIPEIYETDIAGEFFFIASESLTGIILSALLHREQVVGIGIQLCEVLSQLPTCQGVLDDGRWFERVVHGDVRPANIRITESGQVKLLNWGKATEVPGIRARQTRTCLL